METPDPSVPPLFDRARRKVDYLRISITDRCNERCLYCMPRGLKDWKEREEILTYEEILRVVRVALSLGFRKFRITGGEPLVRRDVLDFLTRLGALPGIESLGLSTNATLLAPMAESIRRAGVHSVNISLDTLDAVVYRHLTQWDLADCLAGIRAAREAGFPALKLNTVLMRGVNEEHILPLIEFAREQGAVLRFIELMPVTTTDVLTKENFLPLDEARAIVERSIPLERVSVKLGHGPAVYYRTPDGMHLGFIGAMSDIHFCESCNKVRLTADGKLRPCLGDHLEFDLRATLRGGGDDRELVEVFRNALELKPVEHAFRGAYRPGRSMTAIGG
jgi:GTP 3',8-cyclase